MQLGFYLQKFKKKAQISTFIKVCIVGAELFHVDGRTDRLDEANNRFSQVCKRTKKVAPERSVSS